MQSSTSLFLIGWPCCCYYLSVFVRGCGFVLQSTPVWIVVSNLNRTSVGQLNATIEVVVLS
jgi:hypothetical protein